MKPTIELITGDITKIKSDAIVNAANLSLFPKDLAAKIAIQEVKNFESDVVEKVIFVCFDDINEEIYKKLLD
jgi:O-acetyl-ADP-ribose deacetylase (regulator of RNase III)